MVREFLAEKLRGLAARLDGREMVDVLWHRANVQGMNRYIGQTERYIAALEAYIDRQNTCVVCECCLHPPGMPPHGSPPHCEDSCRPEEEHEIAWHESYLDDPVKQLRERHGRVDTKPMIEAGAWR